MFVIQQKFFPLTAVVLSMQSICIWVNYGYWFLPFQSGMVKNSLEQKPPASSVLFLVWLFVISMRKGFTRNNKFWRNKEIFSVFAFLPNICFQNMVIFHYKWQISFCLPCQCCHCKQQVYSPYCVPVSPLDVAYSFIINIMNKAMHWFHSCWCHRTFTVSK